MRDIPLFNTENGVASLRLKEIPCFQTAYITIQSSLDEDKLLQECVCLCRAAGAERIYATGINEPDDRMGINIIKMTRNIEEQGISEGMLFPVQEETLSQWREIYNKKMYNVTGAAYMSEAMGQQMLADKNGYFVHKSGQLIGIGTAKGDRISAVASLQKGEGKAVVNALLSALSEDVVTIEVASDNHKAIALYASLGFVPTGILNTWYKII